MIVLASTSTIRRHLLRQAGLTFKTARPPVDEGEVKSSLRAAAATANFVAETLAERKAVGVAEILPAAFVIGVDQMLECENRWFDKPTDRAAAREQLQALRGKTHQVITAAALCAEGKLAWQYCETAELTMRDFSDRFLDRYLELVGEAALRSVGGYHLEGLGAQLFDRIKGDYFTILGLPMIPLLNALRQAGALPE
jgi:septum formation protein